MILLGLCMGRLTGKRMCTKLFFEHGEIAARCWVLRTNGFSGRTGGAELVDRLPSGIMLWRTGGQMVWVVSERMRVFPVDKNHWSSL